MNVATDAPAVTIAALIAALLVSPLSIAGIAILFAGLTRTRSVAHCLFLCLAASGVAVAAFLVCGFAIFGSASQPSFSVTFASHSWSLSGAGPLFVHGRRPEDFTVWPAVWFGMIAAALACVIPVGAGVERWRTGAMLCSSAVVAGFSFPLFAHWIWFGWLSNGGAFKGISVLDAAGSAAIQAFGGVQALCAAWLLRPRRGKYNAAGVPLATPGHNAAFILIGCLVALPGWFGLNCAGAILFRGASGLRLPFIAVSTLVSASGGALSACFVTRVRFGKPDASLCANGWIAGLVASSAACVAAQPAQALITGLVAGAIVIYGIELLELRCHVDDPAGAISVHFFAGIWGVLAAGLFDRAETLVAQLLAISALLGFVLPLTYGTQNLINRLLPFRVPAEDERQGMDLAELGAGAYPEFMIHRDDLGFR